jgi:hypothetical protein
MEAHSISSDFSSVSDIQSIQTNQGQTLFRARLEKEETDTDDVFTVEQSNSSVFQVKPKNDLGQGTTSPCEDIENGKCSGWSDLNDIVTLETPTGNEVNKGYRNDLGFKSGDEGALYSKHRNGPVNIIIVTRNEGHDSGENASNHRTSPDSFWEQIICGMHADRMIFLLLSALLVAIAFVVGAIAMTGRSNHDFTPSPSLPSRPDELLPLTLTPDSINSKSPQTSFPTSLPWDKEACGGDSPTAFFTDALDKTLRRCSWLAEDESRVERLCIPGSAAYLLCRESCRNCETQTTTSMPTWT